MQAANPSGNDPSQAAQRAERIASELLQLAYRNNRSSVLVNLAATFGVAFEFSGAGRVWPWLWFGAVLCISLIRLALDLSFSRQFPPGSTLSLAVRRRWQRAYEIGLVAGASMWVLLVWTQLDSQGIEGKFVLIIVVSALAGGATGVLAPLRGVGRIYIGLMLVPACIKLFLLDRPEPVLGVLGLIFFVVMLVGHNNNHKIVRRSLELQEDNAELVAQLTEHNHAVQELNASLEKRVAERTAALQSMANRDALTGLYNRRGLQRWMDDWLAQPSSAGIAVLFLDLDRFKQINDGLGHDLGDRVLQEIARRFEMRLPDDVAVARWGGDEFVVTIPLPADDGDRGMRLAMNLRERITAPLTVEGELLHVGVSIGIARYPRDGKSPSDLISAADLAAAEVKRAGRGQIMMYHDLLSRVQKRRLEISLALRDAVIDGSLRLAYQPIIDAATGRVVALEALLRWEHAVLGSVRPEEFIPIAEESDRIVEIGEWVLKRACTDAMVWGTGADAPAVAVNVSLRQLLTGGFAETVQEALQSTGLPPARLDLEVTESVFSEQHMAPALESLVRLRKEGVRVHVDDFGTGYSSLSRLHEFPLDALKIDRSFVHAIHGHGRAIIEGAALIARRFGLRMIAEGVENAEQAAVLHALGVEYLQGNALGPAGEAPHTVALDPTWLTDVVSPMHSPTQQT